MELDSRGPSSLIESFPKARAAIILGSNKDGFVLFNQTGAELSEAGVKALLDRNSLINLSLDLNAADATGTYDPHDIYDAKGLVRNALSINSLTVEGNYTLKFTVGSIVQEYTIRIVKPQPKVFVLSNWTDLKDSNNYLDNKVQEFEGTHSLGYSSQFELINYRNNNFLGVVADQTGRLGKVDAINGDFVYQTDTAKYYMFDGTQAGQTSNGNWDEVTELVALTTFKNYFKGTADDDAALFALTGMLAGDVYYKTSADGNRLAGYYRYDGKVAQGSTGAAEWDYINPDQLHGKKFAVPNNGVYNIEIPTTVTPSKDILFAEIAIADLPIGNYSYSVVKKYPDGRVEEFNDTIRIANVDANGKGLLDPADGTAALTAAQTAAKNLFINRWRIYETSFELGTYEYIFSIGGTSKTYTINVNEQVSFAIESLTINRKELVLFNNKFRVLDTVASPGIIGDVVANVNLDNLVGDEFYVVYGVETVASSKYDLDGITLQTAYSAFSTAAKKTFLLDNLKPVLGTKSVNLGEIKQVTGQTAPFGTTNDVITYYIEFFRPVAKRLETDIGFESVKVQTIEVKVADPAV